jgi:hypothetical protein
MRSISLFVLGLAVVAFASGCETTQEKSAKLEVTGQEAATEGKIELKRTNRDLEVVDEQLLTDQYGSAVVLKVRNRSDKGQVSVPVQIDVKDRKGKSVFRNDQEGLEDGLLNLQIIGPGETTWWVNDQVLATGKPAKFDYELGPPAGKYPGKVPEIVVSKPKLENDPTSGIFVTGTVVNKSAIEQESLLLYAVAVKSGRVVAAGRGGIPKLKANGKKTPYNIFFIGNPKSAKLEVFATPTTLE